MEEKQNIKLKIIDNKYIMGPLIGEGGVAAVYKAWDMMLHKFVAVKKIHKRYSRNSKFVDMFRKEAVHTARLEHENIVRAVNFIREEDDYYMVLDYVSGVDLEYLIKKCRINSAQAPADISVYIISEVTKALDYAHNLKDGLSGKPLGIIHRDISPGNIMVFFDGRVKLADFGIAKIREEVQSAQEEKKIEGKLSYMSPEHAACKGVDARSDIFSCGLVLYEMLAGEKPYSGGSDIDIWRKAKNAEVDLEKLSESGVNEGLIKIIKNLLQKTPGKRHQSAAELFIDLKKYLSAAAKSADIKNEHLKYVKAALKQEIQDAEIKARQEDEFISGLDMKKLQSAAPKDSKKTGMTEFEKKMRKIEIIESELSGKKNINENQVALSMLEQFLEDDDYRIKIRITEVIHRIDPETAVEIIKDIINREPPGDFRDEACLLLGRLESPYSTGFLLELSGLREDMKDVLYKALMNVYNSSDITDEVLMEKIRVKLDSMVSEEGWIG